MAKFRLIGSVRVDFARTIEADSLNEAREINDAEMMTNPAAVLDGCALAGGLPEYEDIREVKGKDDDDGE